MLGGFSTQGKPSENITDINTFELSGDWQITEMFGLKVGAQYRENDFNTHVSNLAPANQPVLALPAGVTLADITTTIDDLDDKFGSGAPASWLAVDSNDGAMSSTSTRWCSAASNAAQTRPESSRK